MRAAEAVIIKNFENLIVKVIKNDFNLHSRFNVPFVKNIGDYVIIKMKTEEDYQSLVDYARLIGCENQAHREFNKEIIVCTARYDNYSNYVNFLFWYGDKEECIKNYTYFVNVFA